MSPLRVHPRVLLPILGVPLLLSGLLGCSRGGGQSPLAPEASGSIAKAEDHPLDAVPGALLGEGVLGGATLEVDPAALSASVLPLRSAAETDDAYLLSVSAFFSRSDITVDTISETPEHYLLTYTIAHPFEAPADIAGPASATNRADLGISARAMFLLDLPAGADPADHTYFGDVIANTTTLTGVDGLVQPAGLLPSAAGLQANAFPFKLVVDEGLGAVGNRVGIGNTGVGTGNYRHNEGGWQSTNIGPANTGWTGFDYLHHGQAATNSIFIAKAALSAETIQFDLVILAKYTDPRGGTLPTEKRANRLPAIPTDTARFVYRLPFAALDVGKAEYRGEFGGLQPNDTNSATEVWLLVRDWDARATETAQTNLHLEPLIDRIELGGAGVPTVEVDVPGVTSGPVTLTLDDDDTVLFGDLAPESGESGDPLFYRAIVLNDLGGAGGQTARPYTALFRITDASDGNDRTAWERQLLPNLDPVTANFARLQVFQQGEVGLGVLSNNRPSAQVELADGPIPLVGSGGLIEFLLVAEMDAENDPVIYDIDSDFDGSFNPDPGGNGLDPAFAPPPTVSLYSTNAPINSSGATVRYTARVHVYDVAHFLVPQVIDLEYDVLDVNANDPPTALIRLLDGPTPLIPSGGTLTFLLDGENDPDGDTVLYDIDVDYDGATFVPEPDGDDLDPPDPLSLLYVSQPQINPNPPGGGDYAGVASVRYFDPITRSTPQEVLLDYLIDDSLCPVNGVGWNFDFERQGWSPGGLGLPNADAFGWGGWSRGCRDFEAELASGGALNERYWTITNDAGTDGGGNFCADYGPFADYNLVSPPVTVPLLCGAAEVDLVFNLVMWARAAASLEVFVTIDAGCTWTSVQTIQATGAEQILPQQRLALPGIDGAQDIQIRFRYTDATDVPHDDGGGAQTYVGAYIDAIRLEANTTDPLVIGSGRVSFWSDDFEGDTSGWTGFALPQTDATVPAACTENPGPWGSPLVCALDGDRGQATGHAGTFGADRDLCGLFEADLAESSHFNLVSPPIDLTNAGANVVLGWDELSGVDTFIGNAGWTTTVYAAIDPPPGDELAWGAARRVVTHALGEASGTQRLSLDLSDLSGNPNVRLRFQVTSPDVTQTCPPPDDTVCSCFNEGYTFSSAGYIGIDNLTIDEGGC